MTSIDLTIFLDSEPDAPPLNSFVLAEPEGRADFLWHLSEAGEEALLEATAHVWNSLATPRGPRCSAMACKLGLPGKGKIGLYSVLKTFLEDFERECNPPPVPNRNDFGSSEGWYAAVSAHFAAGDAAMNGVINRYSAILDGDASTAQTGSSGVVLTGPWKPINPA